MGTRRQILSLRLVRLALFFWVAFLALFAEVGQAADALRFFKNYFVTGDYVVGGVGLRGTGVNGWATGVINMTGVPCTLGSNDVPCSTPGAVPADIVAAFLYWQTVETTSFPSSRIGYFDGHKILGKVVGDPNIDACWSSGGTNPQVSGRIYRADVLRHLSIDRVNNVRLANGPHTIQLIDSGGGGNGNTPYTNGASLVVVYRVLVAGNPTFVPLRAVVFYDGAFTMPKGSAEMTQVVGGFYQATPAAAARMTMIAANGQPGFAEILKVNGTTLSTNPFTGTAGGSWDNPTFSMNLTENASSYSTTVTPETNQTCVTIAGQVTSLKVKDTDFDGLLDIWEDNGLHLNDAISPATFGGCEQGPCVNLPAMGARKNVRDIFVELDWMRGDDGHLHVPKFAALYAVACTFANNGIAVHFDVGSHYPNEKCSGSADSFIVPASHARGGDVVEESSLRCPIIATSNNNCAYGVQYSVLSYKTGFRVVKDGFRLLQNGVPVVDFPRRFDRNRKDIFHYGLFAHALAGPFDVTTGQPASPDPASVSGVGDRPGGDFMITLGLWRYDDPIPCNPTFDCADQTGSAPVQAGTLAHELGHNLYLSHAGNSRTPNCLPNYPSVMNYLYQVRLLTDGAGNSTVDFSHGTLNHLNETALSEAPGSIGALRYRVRFYGPPLASAEGTAKAYCDGKPITGGPAVRLESPTVGTPDWNRNGTTETVAFDVNYDGVFGGTLFNDSNDWASLNLQQISARLNSNGLSTDVGALDLGALDLGALDLGALDLYLGALDLGALDLGALDLGALDLGALDLGALDLGALDLGALDLGALDLGALDLGEASGDVTFESVNASPEPTSSAQPLAATSQIDSIRLIWGAPSIGQVRQYNIYRSDDGTNFILLNFIAGTPPVPGYVDQISDFENSGAACPNIPTKTCYNKTYTYYVTSMVLDGTQLNESGASNKVTVLVKHLFVIANSHSVVYGEPLTSLTFTAYGEGGPLTGVSCTVSPLPKNVGNYPITCSGPATTSPTTGVTYNQPYNDGVLHTPGTVTVTPRPITVTATANTKTYDGTTSAAALPTITSGSLAYPGQDTANFIETYDNENVGTGKTLTPSGSVNDGNGGNNYNVSFVAANTGIINNAGAVISVIPYDVAYDGLPHTSTGTATGVNGENLTSHLNLSGTTHTEPGDYPTDPWTFNAPNYNIAGGTVHNRITAISGFVATGSMRTARSFHTATLLNNGKVLVAGGLDKNGAPLASAELYDPGTGIFTFTGNNMPNKAAGHTATLLVSGPKAGKVLVVGGGNSSSEIYDPSTNSWSSAGGIGGQRTYHTATLMTNGKVLIAGGSESSNKTTATALLYDPASGAYSNTGNMTVPREFHTATLLPDGTVLIAGGRHTKGSNFIYESSAELYNPATGQFTAVSSTMSAARYGHTAITIDGKLLIAGGGNTGPVAAADLYDPAAGTFTATGSLGTPRQYFTATLFRGSVVAAGGLKDSTRLSSAEQYQGTAFQAMGNMTAQRAAHTATVLSNGWVLVAGGQGSSGASIASAELLK